jgi:hypothetical protein
MGTVYFFREHSRKEVKIGCSTNGYSERFISFNMYAPNGAYVIGCIKTNEPFILEKKIHKNFSHRHIKGEFFEITDEEVMQIISKYDKSAISIATEIQNICEEYDISTNLIYDIIRQGISNYKNIIDLNNSNDYNEKKIIKSINLLLKQIGKNSAETSITSLHKLIGEDFDLKRFRKVIKKYYKILEVKHVNCPFTGESKSMRPVLLIDINLI